MLSGNDWITEFRNRRIAYGVSQNKLAVSAGITREYLNKIESGKMKPSQEIREKLTAELELCIPDRQEEGRIQERSLKESLNRFLEGLSKEKRCIFLRRYWFGDSVKEIAQRYGMGESKVKTTLFRVRNQLRQHLLKEGFSL